MGRPRSEEHTSELQSQSNLVCRLLLEKKKAVGAHLEAGAVGGEGILPAGPASGLVDGRRLGVVLAVIADHLEDRRREPGSRVEGDGVTVADALQVAVDDRRVARVPVRLVRRRARDVFFFLDPATTEIYTLSLHDALPI